MKTSVVITAYNLEKFITDAITSVLNQTRKPDEIIVVDDCSTDTTASIIKSFGDVLTYVKMPQNSGGLKTTFMGLKKATGDVVFFLDGDDVWKDEKIASIMPLYEEDPEMGIVSHNYIRVDENRRDLKVFDDTQENLSRILSTSPDKAQLSEALKDSILAKKGFWGGSAYSLRKKFLDVNLFQDWINNFSDVRYTYLDMVLPTFMIIHRPDFTIGYVDRVLFEYRRHESNTSGNKIPTIEAAKSALRQGYCTSKATYGMFPSTSQYAAYIHRQNLIIEECEYLFAIYDNKKLSAFKKFVYLCRNYWQRPSIIKESQRLLVSIILGPKFFLKLRAKLG